MVRLINAVGFRVMHQAAEGRLWTTVRSGEAALQVPRRVTREELERAVERRPGAYQLVPVNARGEQVGDPPEVVIVRGP